jgi:F420-non-reducing hydrogenase iron-sulfur subunit
MSDRSGHSREFEPRIVAFFCNWCTYTGADLAGTSRMKYAPNARVIRVMCSGRIDPQFIVNAFRQGADGVLIGGCHPGDCHYQEGNYKALRRFRLLKRLVKDLGIEEERLRLEWISASEGDQVQRVMNEMALQIKALGPLVLEPMALTADSNALYGKAAGEDTWLHPKEIVCHE